MLLSVFVTLYARHRVLFLRYIAFHEIVNCWFRWSWKIFKPWLEEIDKNGLQLLRSVHQNGVDNQHTYQKIVIFDECIFRMNGVANNNNLRIGATFRLKEDNPMVMNSPDVMKFRAVSKEGIKRPVCFYWQHEHHWWELQKHVDSLFHSSLPTVAAGLHFQLNGSPPHYASRMRYYLSTRRPNN